MASLSRKDLLSESFGFGTTLCSFNESSVQRYGKRFEILFRRASLVVSTIPLSVFLGEEKPNTVGALIQHTFDDFADFVLEHPDVEDDSLSCCIVTPPIILSSSSKMKSRTMLVRATPTLKSGICYLHALIASDFQ